MAIDRMAGGAAGTIEVISFCAAPKTARCIPRCSVAQINHEQQINRLLCCGWHPHGHEGCVSAVATASVATGEVTAPGPR
jgi:hypothetical protein